MSCDKALTKKILKLFLAPVAILINLLARLIPKDNKTWLFSSWHGRKYADNSRFIFEYALKNDDSLNVYWMCKTLQLKKELRKLGLPVCYCLSLKGIYLHLIASRVIMSHSVHWEYYPALLSSNTKRIQAWHGTPIKKIGYDNLLAEKSLYRDWISRWLFFYNIDHFDLILSNSEFYRQIYSSAFRTDISRVLVTGSPRDDGLMNRTGSLSVESMNKNEGASQSEGYPPGGLTILYAPTLRGAAYSYFSGFDSGGWDFSVVDKYLGEINATLIVKLHPAQLITQKDISTIELCNNIFYSRPSDGLINLESEVSVLVTDYSGIYFDFLLTDKPIFFYIPDEEQFLEHDRDLYLTANELSALIPARDAETLLNQIHDYVQTKTYDFRRLQDLRARFHSFSDGCNSERAFIAIKELS